MRAFVLFALFLFAAPALSQVKPSNPVASKIYVDTQLGNKAPTSNPVFSGRAEMQSLVVGNGGVPIFTYPFAGFSQAKTGVLSSVTGQSEAGPEFAGSFQLVSNGGSSNKFGNFKAAITSVYQALPNAADGWAANLVASSTAGVDPHTGLQTLELDLNNNHYYATGNPATPYITPLYITGGNAIGTSDAGMIIAGSNANFRDGIHFEDRSPAGKSIIQQSTINDRSKSPNILITDTAHVNGIDLINGTFTGFPYRSKGFTVDGNGSITAASASLAGLTITGNAGAAMSVSGSHVLGVDLINGTYGAFAFRSPGFTVDGAGGITANNSLTVTNIATRTEAASFACIDANGTLFKKATACQ